MRSCRIQVEFCVSTKCQISLSAPAKLKSNTGRRLEETRKIKLLEVCLTHCVCTRRAVQYSIIHAIFCCYLPLRWVEMRGYSSIFLPLRSIIKIFLAKWCTSAPLLDWLPHGLFHSIWLRATTLLELFRRNLVSCYMGWMLLAGRALLYCRIIHAESIASAELCRTNFRPRTAII